MRIFKPRYKDRATGQYRDAAKFYVKFADHRRQEHRIPGFTDRRATEQLGRNIEQLVVCRASGQPMNAALAEWLESAPPHILQKLVQYGVVDSTSAAASKPLLEHLDDFITAFAARGRTSKRLRELRTKVTRVVKGCGFQLWSDVTADKVEAYLAGQHESLDNFSIQTSNTHLQVFKQFCRWMVSSGRAQTSPVAFLQRRNVETDRRRRRRALSGKELRKLLRAAADGPVVCGTPGPERALVYRLAVETGLRAGEMSSLKKNSFDLTSVPPTVTVEAGYSKHRREDVLPLRAETALLLGRHLAHKSPKDRALNMPKPDKTASMIRTDLQAAGIPYKDDNDRYADFHALRHTFITNLRESNVHPRIAQALARHSDINLTMGRYTHVSMGAQVDAVEGLGSLGEPPEQEGQVA